MPRAAQSIRRKSFSAPTSSVEPAEIEARRERMPTAIKGLRVLEYLATKADGARLGDIAQAIEMDVGQAHRLVLALVADHWLAPTFEKGSYAITGKVLRIASSYEDKLDLSRIAQPLLDDLQAATGETIHLGELRGSRLICISLRMTEQRLAVFTRVGDEWPLAGTSMGCAIRAALVQRDGRDPIKGDQIPEEVLLAMSTGYGRDFGRYRTEIESVSAAIFAANGDPIGALAVAAPTARVDDETITRYGGLVRDAAAKLSGRLGYSTMAASTAE